MANTSLAATPLGDRWTTEPFERRYYGEDMAPVPRLLVKPFFQTLPDAVARPHTSTEVVEAVRQAITSNLAVVPRAAASTALFQSVPLRGGLVIDFNGLTGAIDLNKAHQTVTVGAGTRWLDLERALQPAGLTLKSYPTSAVTSTVGGWLNTQGYGLGSLLYGPLVDQIARADVVLPDGQLMTITPNSNPPLVWFAGSEGTLGAVTELELTVRPVAASTTNHLLVFESLADLQQATMTMAQVEPRPYTLFFSDETHNRMLEESGFNLPTTQPILLINFQGETHTTVQGARCVAGLPGRPLEATFALAEWQHRLYHLRVKRGGPSLLAAELWLPVNQLAGYLHAVQEFGHRFKTPIGNYGLVVSPTLATVMSLYHTDARQTFDYTLALGLTARLYSLGARFGGRPYGVGLWNTPYLSQIFSSRQLTELRARKKLLDPVGRFNPGKLYQAPFPLWPTVSKPGMAVLSMAYRIRGGRKHHQEVSHV